MVFQSSGGALAFFLACSLKASVVLIVAWLLVVLAPRSSAAFRHLVWAFAALSSLAIPLLALWLPAWNSVALRSAAGLWTGSHSGAAATEGPLLPAMIVRAAAAGPAEHQWSSLALLLWALGFAFFSARIAVGLTRMKQIAKGSPRALAADWAELVSQLSSALKTNRRASLLLSANPTAMPLTWGAFRPVILLPADATNWPAFRRRVVLTHEIAHIARRDWSTQIFAELARAVYWFHPLAWLAARRVRQESEHACDDLVLRTGIAAPDYADQLLDLAGALGKKSRVCSAALAVARPSCLERRFAAMLNPSTNRRSISFRTGLASLCLVLLLLLPLAALRLPAQNTVGQFSGTIHDASGGGVANATVIMTERKTSKIVMSTSDAQGKFSFISLPAGEYELKVLKGGFEEFKAQQSLEAGRHSSQDLTLKVGSVSEQMDVVAQAKTESAGKGEAKTTRVRLGGDVQAPKLINKVQPVYPEDAKAAGSQGTVILRAVIGIDGAPLSLRVVNDQVDPELARAAIESVSKWRYTPTLLNGKPIEVDTTIQVNFTLLP